VTAIEEALERGREVRTKNPKWEPVGVTYPGWLTAQVKDLRNGEVEGVFYAQGKWQFTRLGRDKEGNVKSYDVRDRELKKVVKAMLEPPKEVRDSLIEECAEIRREKAAAGGNGDDKPKRKRMRRGKT
jgi:hypothetical protein